MKLTASDEKRLSRAHPDLAKVIRLAAEKTTIPFTILQSDRTLKEQEENVRKGVSQTMRSRHLISPDGMVRAVDIAPLDGNKASFAWPLYHKLAPIIKDAAKQLGIAIEWGGDWKKFKDGPHWQLPWGKYP